MRRRRTAILALALCLAAGSAGGAAEAKKGKKKSPSTFAASLAVNQAVPDEVAVGPSTPVISTITVPKKFKGRVVGDVNVTGIQTTGNVSDAAGDLLMKLTAPNGRTVQLIDGYGDVSIGPLTLDDDTRTVLCDSPVPDCVFPFQLAQPFAGTANLFNLFAQGSSPLSRLDGVAMRGTWTATIWDERDIGETSVFNSWGLSIKAAKPVK